MSRPLKFRAWHKNAHAMEPVVSFHVGHYVETVCQPDGDHNEEYDWEQVELMQYTGLKDKNGTEIYEGDIVRAFDEAHAVVYGDPDDYPAFHLRPCACEDSNCLQYAHAEMPDSELEVIGNIYENPELLRAAA